MALPPGFLDELRARTPLAAVIGRRVRLAKSGRQWKGCCPFHGEKTPSFYVYDDHFHCFGCGVHGDAISFVMQSQGASFPEAVEQLAAEAGLEVPKSTPAAAEAERRRHDLHSVLAAAASAYQRRLLLPEGRVALDYLRGRGLSEDTIRRFGLGWSGEGRGALAGELARDGIETGMLIEAGLMREPENPEGRPYDLFFNRVMFPIRDRRGQVISFGGRTLGDGQPKYVNGPETELFSKRKNLYALDLAREAARNSAPVVVVEGYMDVIALHQAGFSAAVAPLGTALTAEQLGELWRLSPEPVLCFDGDAAGRRAAERAALGALELLGPDRTLKLAALPDGEDPDTLVRKGGPKKFQDVLTSAQPLADALYGLLRRGDETTPELRAAFRARLEAAAQRIPDKSLAGEYRSALISRFFADRATRRRVNSPVAGRSANGFSPLRPIARTRFTPAAASAERERILTAILLHHPDLLHDVDHAFSELALPGPLDRLRATLLDWSETAAVLDSRELISHLQHLGLAAEVAEALSAVPVPLPACAGPDAQAAEAEAGWWHIFGLMHRERLEQEVAVAREAFAAMGDEAAQRRLIALCAARDKLRRGEQGEAEA